MDGRRQDQRPLRQGRLFSAHERSRQSRPPPVRQVDHGDRAAPVRNRQRGGLALLHSLHRRAHGDPRRPYSHAHVPLPDPDRLRGHRDRPRRDGDRPVAHGDPRQHPGILRAYGILGHSHGPRTTRRATRPQGGACLLYTSPSPRGRSSPRVVSTDAPCRRSTRGGPATSRARGWSWPESCSA